MSSTELAIGGHEKDPEMNVIDVFGAKAAPDEVVVGTHDSQKYESDNDAGVKSRSGLKPFVPLVALTASLGGLIFGFTLTGAGGTFVMDGFQQHFSWSCPSSSNDSSCTPLEPEQVDTQRALISAMLTVGATVGALINPPFMDRWGRVPDLRLACVVFTIGSILCASAPQIAQMYVGRFIAGSGIGMFALCVPVYVAECSPVDYRGMMTTCWQFGVTIGMLIGQGANVALGKVSWGWRVSYSGNILFALLLLGALYTYMPESPRFIASCSKDNDLRQKRLRQVMTKLRYEQDIEHAIDAIEKEVEEDRLMGVASWVEVFAVENKMRYRLFLGIALQAFNQLSGNEAINFYSAIILEDMFGEQQSIFYSFLLGIVNFIAVCVSLATIERFGRIPLFLIGGITMLFSQIANSIYQTVEPSTTTNNLFLASLAIFTFGYHSTWGPLAWDICAEMFPMRERGKAVGLTTMSNFLFNTIVAASFSFTIDASPSGSFAFFCACIFINLTLAYLFLPETGHKTAVQIDESFAKHKPKVCRFST